MIPDTPSSAASGMGADHERIWLEPMAPVYGCEGRQWCQDKVWPDCDGDPEPTEYIRADLHRHALSANDRELAEVRAYHQDALQQLAAARDQRDEAMAALREKEEESARLTRINTEHCATVNAMNVESAKLEDQLRDVQHRLNIRVRAADDRASAAMAALKEYHDAYSDYRFAPEGSWEKGDASARLEDARDAARSVLSSVLTPVSREQESGQ